MSEDEQNERHFVSVSVEPGDPHNDQMAARADGELDQAIQSTRNMLATAETQDKPGAMATIATAFIGNPDFYPHERLASMLAAALLRLAQASDGVDLNGKLTAEEALALGMVHAQALEDAERRGYEQAMASAKVAEWNGWASLPENVRMLITDAALLLQRAIFEGDDTTALAHDFGVWTQHREAVLAGKFGRYALKADGSGVNASPPEPREQIPGLRYLLWDMERQAWWNPARRGYTDDVSEAGRYSEAEAVDLALQGSLGGLGHATVIVADHGSVKR